MLDLRKKLEKLTGSVKGSVVDGLNKLRLGAEDVALSAVTKVGEVVTDKVVDPIFEAKAAVDKKIAQNEGLTKPPVFTEGPTTITRNAEGLPPLVIPPKGKEAIPPQQASVISSMPVAEPKVVTPPKTPIKNVPEQFQSGIKVAMDHLNRFTTGGAKEPENRQYDEVSIDNLLAKIEGEGGWNPTAGNKKVDYGITQLNVSKRKDLKDTKTIWGKSWAENFSKEYGEFNEDDPTHQILGGTIVLSGVRQELTDAFKEGKIKRKPTQSDIFAAYNMDFNQVIDAINGKDYSLQVTSNDGKKKPTTLQQQYQNYLNHLKSKGFTEE